MFCQSECVKVSQYGDAHAGAGCLNPAQSASLWRGGVKWQWEGFAEPSWYSWKWVLVVWGVSGTKAQSYRQGRKFGCLQGVMKKSPPTPYAT
eukprot:1507047-Ditylum_brightwellii.AAC.1